MTDKKVMVSVIMPAYNCAEYMKNSVGSVIAQSFTDWELIVVDDCSTDNTKQVVDDFSRKDERIKYVRLDKNSGAAQARNKGIQLARGKYAAFLDSDDIWMPSKLEKQVDFMSKGGFAFTCTHYEKIDVNGNRIGRTIKCRKKCGYDTVVWINPIGNSTVMIDLEHFGKVSVPGIRKCEDYAFWLALLRTERYVYGLQETLSQYLVRSDSVSADKMSLVKYQYRVYREFEHFCVLRAVFHVCMWGVIKILHIK